MTSISCIFRLQPATIELLIRFFYYLFAVFLRIHFIYYMFPHLWLILWILHCPFVWWPIMAHLFSSNLCILFLSVQLWKIDNLYHTTSCQFILRACLLTVSKLVSHYQEPILFSSFCILKLLNFQLIGNHQVSLLPPGSCMYFTCFKHKLLQLNANWRGASKDFDNFFSFCAFPSVLLLT